MSSAIAVNINEREITPTREFVFTQTEFDKHINWQATELTEFTWLLQGKVDETFFTEGKNIETDRRTTDREWSLYAEKYGLTDATTARTNIEQFTTYPCEETKDVTIQRLETTKETGIIEYSINFPAGFQENISFKCGWNSTIINTTTGSVGGLTSETAGTKIFYSNNTNSIYAIYVGDGSDMYISASANNGTTWIGKHMITGSFGMSSANCALQTINTTTEFIHCITTTNGADSWQYMSYNTSTTSPYFVKNANYTPFDASVMGQSSTDRIYNPQMTVDNEGCKMVLIDFEDDSEALPDEHEVVLFRENETNGCSDVIWENYTMDNGFPLYSIQDEPGYTNVFGTQIVNYNNGNLQLYWGKSNLTTQYNLTTKHYNGTTKTVDVNQRNIYTDIEYGAFGTVLLNNGSSLIFYQPDGATYWRVQYMYGENGSTTNHSASTVTSGDSSTAREGTISASFNWYNNTAYYFYADSSSQDFVRARNITIINSTNISVSSKMNISNNTGTASNNSRDYSSFMDMENCVVHVLSTYGGVGYTILYDKIALNTTLCPSQEPPVSGNTTIIDCTTNPAIITNTDYNGTAVYFNGTGEATFNATISNFTTMYAQNGCSLRRATNGRIQR